LIGQLGNIAEKTELPLFLFSIVLLLCNATGANRLILENSFINYFKSDLATTTAANPHKPVYYF
jgi:hypothetical protein